MEFNFELISKIEAHVLIILSLGLLGIRFIFYDVSQQKTKYKFGHILILMFFTIFSLELLIIMIAFYFYHDLIDIAVISNDIITHYIFIPKLIFYSTLCYFLYWLLKFFQTQNSQNIEDDVSLDHERLIFDLMRHPDFKPAYLLREIRYKEHVIWSGILNGKSHNTVDFLKLGDYSVVQDNDV